MLNEKNIIDNARPIKAKVSGYIATYPSDIAQEVLKPILTYQGRAVRDGYFASSRGYILNGRSGKKLKPQFNTDGKRTLVRISSRKDGQWVQHPMSVARLIMEAFCENPDPATYRRVIHIDRDAENNEITNLAFAVPYSKRPKPTKPKRDLPFRIDVTKPAWRKGRYGFPYAYQLSGEVWKPIRYYKNELKPIIVPGYYISSWGRVYNAKLGRYLRPCMNKATGVRYVKLDTVNGRRRNFSVYWLVARQWIVDKTLEPFLKLSLIQINHINGDRTDDHLQNLEVTVASENIHHYWDVLKPTRMNEMGEHTID